MSIELINQVKDSFDEIRFNNKFFIRDRLYKGTGPYKGMGLNKVHTTFINLQNIIASISEKVIIAEQENLDVSLIKILDSLRIIIQLDQLSPNKDSIKRYMQLIELEMNELSRIVDAMRRVSESDIKDDKTLEDEKREQMQSKIEDNLRQITMSFAWKSTYSQIQSVHDKEAYAERVSLLEKCINSVKTVVEIKFLQTLSQLATKIRDQAGNQIETVDKNLAFFDTLTFLFIDLNLKIPVNDGVNDKFITPYDVKTDVDHYLNTGRLSWLTMLHDYVSEDLEDYQLEFANNLYVMSRDPKELFLWTMNIVSRMHRNSEIIKLSNHYATLASSLLTLTTTLDKIGMKELSKKILEFENISALDAISDIRELYSPENINVQHLITAIRKKLEELKEIAFLLIEYDELALKLFQIFQFTDMDAKLIDIGSLKMYLKNM